MNRRQTKGLIRLDVSVRYDPVPIHNYVEEQLETEVICDQCGLEFAVYGVFASCPDCGQLNALKVLLSSLETAKKKLALSKDRGPGTGPQAGFPQGCTCKFHRSLRCLWKGSPRPPSNGWFQCQVESLPRHRDA